MYDPAWIYAIGDLKIGPYMYGKKQKYYYEADNNMGSGSLDFIAYAPDMDLNNSAWLNKGYYFVTDFRLAGLNNGFEELYITGAFSPHKVIPEPVTALLLGSGLLGLAGMKIRRKS